MGGSNADDGGSEGGMGGTLGGNPVLSATKTRLSGDVLRERPGSVLGPGETGPDEEGSMPAA